MQKIVTHRCKCGYLFKVNEQVEIQLSPSNHPHQGVKTEVITHKEALNEDELKKTYVYCFPLDREVRILACPKCLAPLLID